MIFYHKFLTCTKLDKLIVKIKTQTYSSSEIIRTNKHLYIKLIMRSLTLNIDYTNIDCLQLLTDDLISELSTNKIINQQKNHNYVMLKNI